MTTVTLFGVPAYLLILLCLALSLAYFFVWPRPRPDAPARPPWMQTVLRWGHGGVWLLLAVVCTLMALQQLSAAFILGYLTLGLYLTFITTLMFDRTRKS